ncbi:hypothetical protein LSH36_745g01006 [Paralvinella palmiformis]|uniref:Uncharacterized protein n=1 Tax=Paralvinella palmiformis TaxID=53620 RepID=A0AAD9MT86_9ANNE|nr:hypothetical protein LSH36_745g01006 [Paralvinella palmiformis]
MFVVKGETRLELFCMELSMSYLTMAHNLNASTSNGPSLGVIMGPELTKYRMINRLQKYNHALLLTAALASIAAEVGMQEFEARLATLHELHDQWASCVSITLTCLVSEERASVALQEGSMLQTTYLRV